MVRGDKNYSDVFFLHLLFFLDKKSNKKVKANAIAPQALPGQRT